MTERVISYLILLGATIAVLLVVVIQPRNTALKKQQMLETMNLNLAQTCMIGDISCETSPLKIACENQRGSWSGIGCTYPSIDQTTCVKARYVWDNGVCYFNPTSSSGSAGSATTDENGISQKMSEYIESKCLDHLKVSNVNGNGYEPIWHVYGWFDAVRIPAIQACKRAYIATIGKYGSEDLQGIDTLLMNNNAVPRKEYAISGLLYKALEDTCGSTALSLAETLDPAQEKSIARYLMNVLDIITVFKNITSNLPAYLMDPVPFVIQKDSAILSLETQFARLATACLPPKIEQSEKIAEKPAPEIKAEIIPIKQPAVEAKISPSQQTQAVRLLTQIKNLFKEIRNVAIARMKISRSLDAVKKDSFRMEKMINTFTTCRENGIC